MTAASQLVYLPGFFKIGTGILSSVGRLLKDVGHHRGSVVVASGRHFSAKAAGTIIAGFDSSVHYSHITVDDASDDSVIRLRDECLRINAGLVLSVGGGTVIDVGKRLHRLFNIPNIVIPTVISNDGLISPISVLRTVDGVRDSFPAMMPVGVIVDLDVIRAAPHRYLIAAAGDVLSNLSASEDWRRLSSKQKDGNTFNDLAFHLALGSAQALINMRRIDLSDDAFLECLVRCQIYSGLAMSLAGSSRPCSGAEHLISHAIDQLKLNNGLLHGAQVGSVSLFILYLLDYQLQPALRFARELGLELDWRRLSPEIHANSERIVDLARIVRPGRFTVLDSYSNNKIQKEAELFSRIHAL